MEVLFTPWRSAYLSGGGVDPAEGCLFCVLQEREDADALVVFRGATVYGVLNRYPYTNGHMMIAPYAHHASLAAMADEERRELIELAARTEEVLTAEYAPHGFNAGMNLGTSAGAGVTGHLHLHVVPRWDGDTNFLTVLGGTRTIPEDLPTTRTRLAAAFARRLAGKSAEGRT